MSVAESVALTAFDRATSNASFPSYMLSSGSEILIVPELCPARRVRVLLFVMKSPTANAVPFTVV